MELLKKIVALVTGEGVTRWAGILLAFLALIATYVELRRTANQIEGATLYQIAKDGRDLARDYYKSDKKQIGSVLNYFYSVFVLYKRGVINDDNWMTICQDLSKVLNDNEVKGNVREHLNHFDAADNFNSYVNKIVREGKCD